MARGGLGDTEGRIRGVFSCHPSRRDISSTVMWVEAEHLT